MPYDVLIRGGHIVDGTGKPAFAGDVAVQDGKVAAVGKVHGSAKQTINADGLVVAPGFIDLHTHYDAQLFWDPLATSSCWHGVTTVLTGNCGFTIAPVKPPDREYIMRLMARVEGISFDVLSKGFDWEWVTFGDYLRRMESRLGVNVAAQVGHSALRYYVMGPEAYRRAATESEVAAMAANLADAMAAGAIGFSTSQTAHHTGGYGEPIPSRMSEPQELLALAGVLRKVGGGMLTLNPKPGQSVINEQFQELLIQIAQASGSYIVWNSIARRWDMPDQWKVNLAYMERAAAKDAKIYAVGRCQSLDLEFNLHKTNQFDPFPAWKEIITKPEAEKQRLLATEDVRARLRVDWDRMKAIPPHKQRMDLLEVSRTTTPANKRLEGKRIYALAAQMGKHPVDVLLDIALSERLDTQFTYIGAMNGDMAAVEQIVKSPYCVPGVSDAGAHLDTDCGVDFIAVLLGHWVRERGVLSLGEAVRRLTSLPARLMGVADRGVLREGMAADVVVFDPASIKALPREITSDLPHGGRRIIQRAQGVHSVMVNGEVLLTDSKHTGAMPGRLLRPSAIAG
ncbi:MAG: amidohydrolase family protein [Chloroflexi bacterium]|nr:amidohydrolase family protein [Chloroflexota bacterium]